MKITSNFIILCLSALGVRGQVHEQPERYLLSRQSEPFQLLVRSTTNETLDGSALLACHVGGPGGGENLASLCVPPDKPSVVSPFSLSYSDNSSTGMLTFDYMRETPPQGAALIYDPASNLAFPMLWGEYDYLQLHFDDKGRAFVQSEYTDTTFPRTRGPYFYNNWYICWMQWAGLKRRTLSWVVGSGELRPQNPTCEKVDLVRVFI